MKKGLSRDEENPVLAVLSNGKAHSPGQRIALGEEAELGSITCELETKFGQRLT